MAKMKKPKDLQQLKVRLEAIYADFRKDVETSRGIYRKEFKNLPRLPQGVAIHKSSTGRNLADNLADQILTNNPLVTFAARGGSQVQLKHKDQMEQWGQFIMERVSRETLIDPFEQVKKDLLVDGAACVKFTVNTNLMPEVPKRADFDSDKKYKEGLKEWEVKDSNVWAWDVRPIDVLQVLPAPGRNSHPPFVLEVRHRFAYELEVDYDGEDGRPFWVDPGDDPLRLIEVLEYWDEDNYILEIDKGHRVFDKRNPYGVLPYSWAYNGLGRLDVSGDPRFYGEGILMPILGELESEVRIKTAQDAQWQFHVFPRLITTLPAAQAHRQFMKGPGGIITVTDMSQAPKWLESTPPNPQMTAFLAEVKTTMAQRFPPSLTQRSPGVDAAVHQAMLLGQALKPLLPIKVALNKIATTMIRGMAQQMVYLEMKCNVFGSKRPTDKDRMVKWSDFTHYNFEVTYEATDPAEDQRKMMTGLALLRVPGLLSRRSFRETFAAALKLSNDEEEKRVIIERTLDLLSQQGLLIQDVMQEENELTTQSQAQGMIGGLNAALGGARERSLEEAGAPPQGNRPEVNEGFRAGGV